MAEMQNGQNQNNMMPSSSVPPPPAEVKVRTMKSDIEGIAQAGGGSPQYRTVSVEGMGLPKSRIGGFSPQTPHEAGAARQGFPWWIIALIIVALGILVFFGYVVFIKK